MSRAPTRRVRKGVWVVGRSMLSVIVLALSMSAVASAQTSAVSNRVVAVRVDDEGERSVVAVATSMRPEYEVSTLVSPPRLVVDIRSARFEGTFARLRASTRHIDGISTSSRVVDGEPTARLILQLRGEVAHRVGSTEEGLTIRLTGEPAVRQSEDGVASARERAALDGLRQACEELVPEELRAGGAGVLREAREQVAGLRGRVDRLERALLASQREAEQWRARARATAEIARAAGVAGREGPGAAIDEESTSGAGDVAVVRAPAEAERPAAARALSEVSTPAASPRVSNTSEEELSSRSENRRSSRIEHIVVAGENLTRIAARYGVSLAQLLRWNRGLEADRVLAGQRLTVFRGAPRLHRVVEGEVLSVIAQRYDVALEEIVRLNDNIDPDTIRAGELLRIRP